MGPIFEERLRKENRSLPLGFLYVFLIERFCRSPLVQPHNSSRARLPFLVQRTNGHHVMGKDRSFKGRTQELEINFMSKD